MMLKKKIVILLCAIIIFQTTSAQVNSKDDLVFDSLPVRWDEAIPLGNGMLGALIWQKGNKLRFSIDRADLWDERPAMDLSKFNFKWVQHQVAKKQYDTVQKLGDDPYETLPYPTKLPAGAIEFNINSFGKVKSSMLDIQHALCKVVWESGVEMETFVCANAGFGVFRFKNVSENIIANIIAPPYHTDKKGSTGNSVEGHGLERLGYQQGNVIRGKNFLQYNQPVTNGEAYVIKVTWKEESNEVNGVWSINKISINKVTNNATEIIDTSFAKHCLWWKNFWNKSSVSVPDQQIEKQYYLELYKLGCVARKGAPAITLQAIWTADNGNLPPWKGDFHNDLNTQLSYWPCYTSNHLEEAKTFTDWLWKIKNENEKYTKQYFGVDGLNVPGVVTISGYPMGGWIQYSLSPTIAAWLSQHFYWQWKYSMDKNFLQTEAYPYLHEVSVFLENISYMENGKRKLPLSSSPEYNDNDMSAWFLNTTNYDLSLMKFAFNAAAECAIAMNKKDEALHWEKINGELPALNVDETGLTIAPGFPRKVSHRHHSNLMSIYPLGLLNVNNAHDKMIIDSSLRWMEKTGTDEWCGYSFSWAASLYARAKQGDSAAKELKIFSSNFCSPNSFHLNGDQKGGQYSKFTYHPFTLEGNLAFAQALNEMLLQSYSGIIEIFPAVPASWKDISFNNLRAEGAFIISAKRSNGQTEEIKIIAEQGGELLLKLPFKTFYISTLDKKYLVKDGVIEIVMEKGEMLYIKNGFE
jgi:alpha-L-fucosidase 2